MNLTPSGVATHLHLGALIGVDIAGQRRLVNIGAVGLIEQIVRQQQIVAVDPLGLALVGPGRMPGIADDRFRVGQRRIAHPDPDQVVALLDRKGAYPRARRDHRLAGYFDALAGAVEHHAVIFAADVLAEDFAARQRHAAMAAAVLQRDHRAVGGPIEHHRLVEQRPAHRLRRDLAAPGRNVPGVIEIHLPSPLTAGNEPDYRTIQAIRQ